MDITRTHRHATSTRTTIPRHIERALKITPGDYIIWTWNSAGHAEVRPVPKPHEMTKTTPKKR